MDTNNHGMAQGIGGIPCAGANNGGIFRPPPRGGLGARYQPGSPRVTHDPLGDACDGDEWLFHMAYVCD